VVVGATMRLTRLIIGDELGGWVLREPAEQWAWRKEPAEDGWRHKLVSGLSCPFCVGFWIGVGVLAGHAVLGRSSAWRFALTALALNEVAGRLTLLEEFVDQSDPAWADQLREGKR
jgi:hypothetical protein